MEPFIVLDTDSIQVDMLWARIQAELAAGHAVYLCGALVAPLVKRYGVQKDNAYWIPIVPTAPPAPWLTRSRDILFAAAALSVLTPLLLFLALLVKVSSPGPVFHTARVVGQARRQFVWHKFRSMRIVPSADDQAARRRQFREFVQNKHTGKVIDSARVTRTGAFLRKYSLDELPQLWNVLKGEMSLVGPRPCLPYEEELFPDWAAPRFAIRPGLTGVWQVEGRSRVFFAQSLAMDLYYCYSRSFRLDLYLILQTVGVVLRGQGGE